MTYSKQQESDEKIYKIIIDKMFLIRYNGYT